MVENAEDGWNYLVWLAIGAVAWATFRWGAHMLQQEGQLPPSTPANPAKGPIPASTLAGGVY